MPDVLACFERLLVAVLVGLLIGVERERAEVRKAQPLFAGIRTFPLIALAGAVPALLIPVVGPALLVVSLLAVATIAAIAYVRTTASRSVGATTEFAGIVTFLLGAMAGTGEQLVAGGAGIVVALLLVAKPGLESFSRALTEKEVGSALQLAILAGIVLPLLPNRGFGPWEVLNPFDIWLVVVLVSAFSFAGFIAMRLLGRERGIVVSGVMGALVSSTAVTVAMAERSKDDATIASAAARSTVLASTVMGVRVAAFAGTFGSGILPRLVPVVAAITTVGLVASSLLARHDAAEGKSATADAPDNPFSLQAALSFAALYVLVVFVVRAAREYLGGAGTYAAAALSSLVDVDAATIAIARGGPGDDHWRAAAAAVTIAIFVNTIVKLAIAWVVGEGAFRRYVATSLALMALAAAATGWAVWAAMP